MRHRVICATKRDFRTVCCTCTCMPHLSCHCLRRYILSSASDHGASCTHTCRPGLSFHILGRFNILPSVCIRPLLLHVHLHTLYCHFHNDDRDDNDGGVHDDVDYSSCGNDDDVSVYFVILCLSTAKPMVVVTMKMIVS